MVNPLKILVIRTKIDEKNSLINTNLAWEELDDIENCFSTICPSCDEPLVVNVSVELCLDRQIEEIYQVKEEKSVWNDEKTEELEAEVLDETTCEVDDTKTESSEVFEEFLEEYLEENETETQKNIESPRKLENRDENDLLFKCETCHEVRFFYIF